jgi:DNA helicase MCM8
MIRLAEARARCNLREVVTEDDAFDVIELMKFSLWDTYQDSNGRLDFQRSQHGSGTSKRGEPKRFVEALQKYAAQTLNTVVTHDSLLLIAQQIGVTSRVSELIDALNHQGYLIKKANRQYQLTV